MSSVCIIPARGGSKRIPRKNIRDFAGIPMIAHSIKAAQNSGLFARIVVSSDDNEIMTIASQYGAESPFTRPDHLANDFAGTDAVMIHALEWFEAAGEQYDTVCCLYATAPFVSADDLQRGYNALLSNRATSAFSVTTYAYPIFRALRMDTEGRLRMYWPEYFTTRSQDLPEVMHDAGQFYWANVIKYRQEGRLFSSDAVPVMIPRCKVQDIDTEEDWQQAERMFNAARQL